jgi:CDP-glucose 4,6-dehydratase
MGNLMGTFFDAFKNKRVLVTGHTGFKGSWLTAWLLKLGAKVTGFSLEPETDPALFDILGLASRVDHVISDIGDYHSIEDIVLEVKPEIVFHLAAQPLVRRSYDNPVETYHTNVMGTVNLLESIRKVGEVKSCVVITTDKCYENREWMYGYREHDPMGGHDPYSSSKGCAELVASAWRQSFFAESGKKSTGLATARAGNIIGGGDWSEDRLVPDIVRGIIGGDTIQLRSPDSIRPWQHVLEPLSGYMQLGASLATGDKRVASAWNFGPEDESVITVEDLTARVINLWGDGKFLSSGKKGPHEARLLKLDITKAKTALGWKPALNIDDALKLTVDWYKRFYDGKEDMYDVTLSQVNDYESTVTQYIMDN